MRCLFVLLLSLLLAEGLAADGQPAAAAGTSTGPRFRVSGAVLPVRQATVAGARFELAPFPSSQGGEPLPNPIFADGFE